MITSKKDLAYFLECDKVALGIKKKKLPLIKGEKDLIWQYEVFLRKLEYHTNVTNNYLARKYYSYRRNRLGLKLGFLFPINKVGPGLSIAHAGTVIVNSNCVVGANCRFQTGVTLGATNGSDEAPHVGNNVFFGDGCKVIGNIKIADDVAIGANAVVVKSIAQSGSSWGGVPAAKISNNNSHSNLILATRLVDVKQYL